MNKSAIERLLAANSITEVESIFNNLGDLRWWPEVETAKHTTMLRLTNGFWIGDYITTRNAQSSLDTGTIEGFDEQGGKVYALFNHRMSIAPVSDLISTKQGLQ